MNSQNKEKLYNYLIHNKKDNLNKKHFYFLIIDGGKDLETKKFQAFFEDILNEVVFFEYDEKIIAVYFEEFEFDFEDIISSLIDDFFTKFSIYVSSKQSFSNNNFLEIFALYNKHLKNKQKPYMTNQDLVTEIIKNDPNDLKIIKPIILKTVLEDPQIESLIKAMFETNLNVTQTANLIYMHRNTVINKLDYIKKETGLNLQKFYDANILYWLLKVK